MMAKKKKGPAADALAQLEALEVTEEETTTAVEERPSLRVTTKGSKKKKKKGPAADALALLEAAEAAVVPAVEGVLCILQKLTSCAHEGST